MKNQMDRLVPAVRKELRANQERVRKQAEARAASVASMVESCDHAIIGTTLDGTVLSWSTGSEHLFGYTVMEMVGHSCAVLVPPYRPEDLSEVLQRIGAGGQFESCETALLRKDRKPVHVLLAVSPIKDPSGRVIGASIMVHNITRSKLEENERLALIQELSEALALVSNARVQTSGKR